MSSVTKWIVPSHFAEENRFHEKIEFQLTDYIKLILKNEVWKRKYEYGFNLGLENTKLNDIESAVIKIYPRQFSGRINDNRIIEIVKDECGKIPTHFILRNYKDWFHFNGLTIIEVKYKNSTKNVPSRKAFKDYIPDIEVDFLEAIDRQKAVLNELAHFFLSGLHLSFPTTASMQRNENPLVDGFFYIESKRRKYVSKFSTNAFLHSTLIITSKKTVLDGNLRGLAKVWHLNLWSLKRYLSAVESDLISMDHLLDLIYSLEGLFEKSTSSDFIKIMCIVTLCKTEKESKEMMMLLDLAYRIRNDIAHGGMSYGIYDKVKLGGKEILAQKVYWQTKPIVAYMIIEAISKLLKNTEMKNLRLTEEDLIHSIYKRNQP